MADASGIDWQEQDRAAVASVLETWEPVDPVSANWYGVIEQNSSFATDPKPTGDPARPRIFVVWAIRYHRTEGTYDPAIAPYREGELILGVYTEPGAKVGKTARVFSQLRALFATADVGTLVLQHDLGLPEQLGRQGEWYAEALRLPFTGG